jgi:Tfp pilus assembly protein PilN
MRELEFLPDWYPTLRRKRRVLLIEGWLTIAIVGVLGIWLILSAHNVIARESLLHLQDKQLTQSSAELQKLAELQSLERQMDDQYKLMSHLGPNVPMGRLMDTLEQSLPPGVALLDVSVNFQKGVKLQSGRQGTTTTSDPQYVIEIHGVSPGDAELGNFMTRLARNVPQYVGGSMMGERDIRQDNHLMRDFNFSFAIRMNGVENSQR